ncbi:hypothetical protein H310_15295 [Aphanomyces invadans]|uniref:Uncharacterized protein n=1 Tax=Aphanomyces invadans TaxID=157072 RepID=A0A024T966_9STRA|nr:hypothetical protein H310_15295 [Aphanomyces invadans]ETV89867.1 hypothetical protein H310_15295 [Aphanomyces invadans]|eukprot:XP_008881501.1 hypothetical protein H310_15295 [Aphanomyces invadans]
MPNPQDYHPQPHQGSFKAQGPLKLRQAFPDAEQPRRSVEVGVQLRSTFVEWTPCFRQHVKRKFYVYKDEEVAKRVVKSKSHITKVMFLVAIARPRFDHHAKKTFDGKRYIPTPS